MSNHDHQSNDGQCSATDAQGAGARDEQESPKPSPLKNPKVKWTLILVGVLVLILLVVWLACYLIKGRYMQDTNNAYLQADSVAVAPRVSGYVTKVLVSDNQIVEAGQPLLQIDDRTYQPPCSRPKPPSPHARPISSLPPPMSPRRSRRCCRHAPRSLPRLPPSGSPRPR